MTIPEPCYGCGGTGEEVTDNGGLTSCGYCGGSGTDEGRKEYQAWRDEMDAKVAAENRAAMRFMLISLLALGGMAVSGWFWWRVITKVFFE